MAQKCTKSSDTSLHGNVVNNDNSIITTQPYDGDDNSVVVVSNGEASSKVNNDDSSISTQPYDGDDNFVAVANGEASSKPTWGVLHPVGRNIGPPLDLKNAEYTFGRHWKNDFKFSLDHVGDAKILSTISKYHFKITFYRDVNKIYITNYSSNGTFVNKVLCGSKMELSNSDEIAVGLPQHKVYVFVDTSVNITWMPSYMTEKFSLRTILGFGGFGEVRLATSKKVPYSLVAIKKCKKSKRKDNRVLDEAMIMGKLTHPCIVTLHDVHDTPEYVFLVLEYVPGGNLSMKVREGIEEHQVKEYIYQLAVVLQYLHGQGVAHRDLKPENVLLAPVDGGTLLKVTDFGFSKEWDTLEDHVSMHTECGTIMYQAPEFFSSNVSYNCKVDIWSLGVITYYCLSGRTPFFQRNERTRHEVIENIVRCRFSMSGPEWRNISKNAIRLIMKTLVVNPTERITAQEVLDQPWLKSETLKMKINKLMDADSNKYGNQSPEDEQPTSSRPKRVCRGFRL